MESQLYKSRFSGATLSKLAGITERQFESLRGSGLLETKSRYSIQDVIFVALTNTFRVAQSKSWISIFNLFNSSFKSVENVKKIDCLNNDVLLIFKSDKTCFFSLRSKDDDYVKKCTALNLASVKAVEDIIGKKISLYTNFSVSMGDDKEIYFIYLYKIVDEIIAKSKELDLKVDVENILLSA
jgi:hypothetical protein